MIRNHENERCMAEVAGSGITMETAYNLQQLIVWCVHSALRDKVELTNVTSAKFAKKKISQKPNNNKSGNASPI